ncbi:hypothetical protein FOZ60_007119 [Perkinsus olseni]|uniref:Uncharacterized protein n=1 Tax=Perkinsus olseni TaxID=32597 RepID=A0A7J6NNB0_PEROL|nr:hypothetical protein FOZ60_007119 [Perkinsus olseni]
MVNDGLDALIKRATDHLVFCGHMISGREIGLPLLTPCPQRRDLSSAAFEAEWEIFVKKLVWPLVGRPGPRCSALSQWCCQEIAQ